MMPSPVRRGLVRVVVAVVVAASSLVLATPAQAQLNIIPTFDVSITSDPNSAQIQATINAAINEYRVAFSDNINVRITFQKMGTGLGQSSTAVIQVPYTTYRTAWLTRISGADDISAQASLPNQTNTPVNNIADILITTANARALGIIGNGGGTDGTIGLNTSIMNLSPPPGNPAFFDLKGVAQHEMDEVLGTISGVGSAFALSPDHFRYSAPGVRSFVTTLNATAFFSVNQGTTNLANYNQSGSGDFGDWNVQGAPRVQDFQGTPNATPDLGVELRLLDVVGYTRSAAVPEPTSIATVGLIGFGAAAYARHRRRRLNIVPHDELD